MNYFIYASRHFTPHGRYELNKLTSLPMCGFIAQLVEHRTGIRGGHGFESRWSPDFFQASSFQLLKLENLLRRSFFTLIYHRSSHMNYFIYASRHFTPHGRYELNKLTSLPMCGFIAQLVEHRTGIRGGHGFESRWSPDFFFRLLLSNCLNWKIYCDDHSSLWSTTAVHIWIISYMLHAISLLTGDMNSTNWPRSQCVAS